MLRGSRCTLKSKRRCICRTGRSRRSRSTKLGRIKPGEPNTPNGPLMYGTLPLRTLVLAGLLMASSRTYPLSYIDVYWQCRPTQPSVAAPHQVIEKPGFYDYAWLEPLLDISSGTFPSGLYQDPMIDLPAKDFKPRSELDTKIQAQCKGSRMI
jgi:hypothetical protein